jgi:hypothetical protein
MVLLCSAAGFGFSAGRTASLYRPQPIKVKFRKDWGHCEEETLIIYCIKEFGCRIEEMTRQKYGYTNLSAASRTGRAAADNPPTLSASTNG